MKSIIEHTIEKNRDGFGRIRRTKVIQDNKLRVNNSDLLVAKAYEIVWFSLALIEILIGFRVILKLLGANPFSGFGSFIYSISSPLVSPFNGILRASFGPNGSVIEWSSVLAGVVYAIIAWIIVYLLQILHPSHIDRIDEEEIID